ncbi:MAG: adenosylcobinamide-GDP ribazoletransferase [Desulfopila sp.]
MAASSDHAPQEPPFAPLATLCCAVRFLTVVPVGWQADKDGQLFPRCVFFFGVVGLLIGGVGSLLCQLAALLLPTGAVVFLAILFLSGISGFLHLDGLGDSADGLLSARPRARSLEIMKDSRTGAMAVVVLVLVLLGKYAALSSVADQHLALVVFCMPLAGRTAIVITMACQPYARAEGGIGALFYSTRTRYAAGVGLLVLLGAGAVAGGLETMAVVLLVVSFTVCWFGMFCRKRLGGVTGDTLGAVCELTEMSVALGLASLFGP